MLKVTSQATRQIKKILGNNQAIFFGATCGGCNGFKYVMKPVKEVIHGDNMDELVSCNEIPFLICGKSIFLVMGTEIDYVEDFMGSRFVFENPNSNSSCGCGNTFSFKDS